MAGPRSERPKRRDTASASNGDIPIADAGLALLLALFVAALWPNLATPPLALDDQSLLKEFAAGPLARVLGYDHFGHLRPAKNLAFYWLARHAEHVWVFRAATLAACVLCAIGVRRLAGTLLARPLLACAAAALWLYNPTTVTVSSWLAASNYVYALLGILSYLLLGLRALRDGANGRAAGLLLVLGQGALLFAVLHHELASLAPALLFAHHSARPGARALGRRAVLVLAGAAASVIALPLLLRALHTGPELAYRASAHESARLAASAARYVAENLRLWFWPSASFGVLLTDDPGAHGVETLLWWIVAAVATWAGWRVARRDRVVAVALCWLVVFLVPLSNLVPLGNTPVALQYLCWPAVGLALLAARGLERLSVRLPRVAAWSVPLGVAAALLAWQPAFWQAARAWRDALPLYRTTLEHYPRNIEVRANLAATYLQRKQHAEAASLLRSSLGLAPRDVNLLGNQFELLVATGQLAQALEILDAHPELSRAAPELLVQRGQLLLQLGRTQQAREALSFALRTSADPKHRFAAGYQLALLLVEEQRLRDARAILDQLLEDFPGNADLTLAIRLIDGQLERRRH